MQPLPLTKANRKTPLFTVSAISAASLHFPDKLDMAKKAGQSGVLPAVKASFDFRGGEEFRLQAQITQAARALGLRNPGAAFANVTTTEEGYKVQVNWSGRGNGAGSTYDGEATSTSLFGAARNALKAATINKQEVLATKHQETHIRHNARNGKIPNKDAAKPLTFAEAEAEAQAAGPKPYASAEEWVAESFPADEAAGNYDEVKADHIAAALNQDRPRLATQNTRRFETQERPDLNLLPVEIRRPTIPLTKKEWNNRHDVLLAAQPS